MVAITGAGISLAGGGITYGQLSRMIRQGGLESDFDFYIVVKDGISDIAAETTKAYKAVRRVKQRLQFCACIMY